MHSSLLPIISLCVRLLHVYASYNPAGGGHGKFRPKIGALHPLGLGSSYSMRDASSLNMFQGRMAKEDPKLDTCIRAIKGQAAYTQWKHAEFAIGRSRCASQSRPSIEMTKHRGDDSAAVIA